ncbi:UNVERIFIED_CONTAM: pseudouridine kinase [Brevibacillus sp. OAP136]
MNMSHLVTVIGTVFVDCKGFPFQTYHATTRNLGSIQFVHGGVGRNIAENMARLSISTSFVSSVDATGMGTEVIDRLNDLNIHTGFMQAAPARGMGMWMAILDERGELAGSISQMPELDVFEQIVAQHGEAIVAQSSHIALELDLNETIAKRILTLAHAAGKPVYGIPGNLDTIMQHPELLQGLSCFICNNYEADMLMQQPFSEQAPEEQKRLLAEYVKRAGLRSMIVTLGEQGSVYYHAETNETGHQHVFPVQVVDTSGAGDAFFSGAVAALVRGADLKEATICGTKVAGWTISQSDTTCPDLHHRMEADEIVMSILSASTTHN